MSGQTGGRSFVDAGMVVGDRQVAYCVYGDGPHDVLSPRGHAEYLLSSSPGGTRHELSAGGHILTDADLEAIYDALLRS